MGERRDEDSGMAVDNPQLRLPDRFSGGQYGTNDASGNSGTSVQS